jgi:hypothetical protein
MRGSPTRCFRTRSRLENTVEAFCMAMLESQLNQRTIAQAMTQEITELKCDKCGAVFTEEKMLLKHKAVHKTSSGPSYGDYGSASGSGTTPPPSEIEGSEKEEPPKDESAVPSPPTPTPGPGPSPVPRPVQA